MKYVKNTRTDKDERSLTTKGEQFRYHAVSLYINILRYQELLAKWQDDSFCKNKRSEIYLFGSRRLTRETNGKDIIYLNVTDYHFFRVRPVIIAHNYRLIIITIINYGSSTSPPSSLLWLLLLYNWCECGHKNKVYVVEGRPIPPPAVSFSTKFQTSH